LIVRIVAINKSASYRPRLEIYTDGSCKPNPGKGGAASILLKNDKVIFKRHHFQPFATNQSMELMAMLLGMNSLRTFVIENPNSNGYRVNLFTDSRYVKDGIMFWMKDWKRNGWTKGKGESISNIGLWMAIDELMFMLDNLNIRLRFHWVKSHNGNKYNEMADKEAEYARNLCF